MPKQIRAILLQLHLWTGLAAGIFFVLLGISGSLLVYPGLMQSQPAIPKAAAEGAPLPLEQVISAARDSDPRNAGRSANVSFPRQPGDAITIQFTAPRSGAARGARGGGEGARGGAGGSRG